MPRYDSCRKGFTKIEKMKNRWANNDMSPKMFFDQYFSKFSNLEYCDFLTLINFDEMWTSELQAAYDDFYKHSN